MRFAFALVPLMCAFWAFRRRRRAAASRLMAEEIAAVLDYWFGGDLSVNYATKWFPQPNSSLQAATDEVRIA